MMAHNAAIYEFPVSPADLYDAEPEFLTYIDLALEHMAITRSKQQDEASK